jgi:hypothetical protein
VGGRSILSLAHSKAGSELYSLGIFCFFFINSYLLFLKLGLFFFGFSFFRWPTDWRSTTTYFLFFFPICWLPSYNSRPHVFTDDVTSIDGRGANGQLCD